MYPTATAAGSRSEELRTELAQAASRLAARPGVKGAYIDVGLDLWQALRIRERAASDPAATA